MQRTADLVVTENFLPYMGGFRQSAAERTFGMTFASAEAVEIRCRLVMYAG
jgi:hypothetical protein